MIFSEGPKKELLALIKKRGALALDDAASTLQLAKTTIRQHLLALESRGIVKRRYEVSGQGRPSVLFEIAEAGERLFPTQDTTLLRELIGFLTTAGEQKAIERFFESYWEKRREKFLKIFTALPKKKPEIKRRLESLQTLLELEGFMPRIEHSDSKTTIRECHCPYPETIRATKLPCQHESEFIRWALKTPIERSEYIPNGDPACTYSSKVKEQ